MFNIALATGVEFAQALMGGQAVSVRLPRIENGVALTDGVFSVDDGTLLYGSGYEQLNPEAAADAGSDSGKLKKEEEAMAVGVGVAAGKAFNSSPFSAQLKPLVSRVPVFTPCYHSRYTSKVLKLS